MVKDSIVEYLSDITRKLETQKDFSIYTAEHIAAVMNLKRNTVSGYLNQLTAQDVLVKTSSRPVCFLTIRFWKNCWEFPFTQIRFCLLRNFCH